MTTSTNMNCFPNALAAHADEGIRCHVERTIVSTPQLPPKLISVGPCMIVDDQPDDASQRRKSDHRLTDGHNASATPADMYKRPDCEQTEFDILNSSGKTARGVEIELTGIAVEDVFHAFYLNRHGSPVISRTANAILVRFECLWRTGVHIFSLTRQLHAAVTVSRPFVWDIALLGGGGSERLCVEMSTRKVKATYRWLVESDETGDALVVVASPAFTHDARTGII